MRTFHKLLLINLFAVVLVLSSSLHTALPVRAQTSAPGDPVYIYLFWGDGCPHCAKAKPYFEKLATSYPQVILKSYEIYYSAENQMLFSMMARKYGVSQLAVPTIFLGEHYLQGYSEELNPDIEAAVMKCITNGCIDPAEGIVIKTSIPAIITSATRAPQETPTSTPVMSTTALPEKEQTNDNDSAGLSGNLNQLHDLDIPVLGKVNLDSQSIILSTALIAAVDGFNPCSLWVLTMLLALTLHTGSRKKVFIVGIVFLTITAGIYALFIAGLFSVLKITSFMGWIRVLVALIALVFAMVNIKDYFWYKEGLSFTIADDKKPVLFKKMRAVMDASQSFGSLIGATIALSAGVSLVEFSCTAGFPIIWTNMLTAQNINGIAFILLLILYMLIYQLDEMIIFFSSVASLKASRMEEKHGRLLKLISGMLMLTLAIVMLVNPSLMNALSSSLLIFGIAIFATLAIVLIHRYFLPKLGIHIGSGLSGK